MASPDDISLTIRQIYRCESRSVFDAWLDRNAVARWVGAESSKPQGLHIDPRVGGEFRYESYDVELDQKLKFCGMFRELESPRRLQFLFWWCTKHDQRVTPGIVTVELREDDGKTELTLTHKGIRSMEERDLIERKWHRDLERMRAVVEGKRRWFGLQKFLSF
jgi:uncharacterized protein YndB with AHSA1/START domain